MAIRLPQTKLVPGGAYRQIAENAMSKPPTEGVVPGSSLREMVKSPIIGGEPVGSQKIFSVRPEVNPSADITSPAPSGGPSNVVPAAPTYVPPSPGAGLPSVEEAQSIIRDAISGVTGAPSSVAASTAPSSAQGPSNRGSVMGATAPVGNLSPISLSGGFASQASSRPSGVAPLGNPGGGGSMPGRAILGSPIIGGVKQGTGSILSKIVPTISSIVSKAPEALDFLSKFIPSPLRIPFLMPNLPTPGRRQGGIA